MTLRSAPRRRLTSTPKMTPNMTPTMISRRMSRRMVKGTRSILPLLSLSLGILFAGCSLGGAETFSIEDEESKTGVDAGSVEQPGNPLSRAASTIDVRDMQARIDFLASDALRGRATPSRGLEIAASYLASEFAALGLEPGGDDGGYIQRFPLPAPPRDTTAAEATGSDPTVADEPTPPSSNGSPEGAPNVVAIFRGSDPELRDTYVVFSAHVDHLGVGEPDASGDSIYNGADDDASGTSALVEIAEAFSMLGDADSRPARSVVFLGVSGEERGLLGSEWFTEHPTIPLDNVVANVNMDMIARNAPDTIVVIGQEYSSLGPLVRGVARERGELGLTVAPDPWPEERFFFRSDHYHFARREIPALFFFAGVHEDYHQPSDEPETVDADKAARVARLAFYTAHAIALDRDVPRWTADGLAEVRALTAQ